MGLISCPDCKKKISTKADACPRCGSPIATNQLSEEQAPINRTTVQLTSKNLKMQIIISSVLFWGGLIVGYNMVKVNAGGGNPETISYSAFSVVIGFVWYIITKIRVWWHHD